MTARNVRAYQTKGLIPPPTRQGRRSVYGLEHLRRLQAIDRARARGASLSLIASHLAEGLPLDDDTLVDWRPEARGGDQRRHPPRPQRAEIGQLLAKLDPRRDPTARTEVDALIAAGVFQQEGRRVYTGRDLAAALTALQRHGLPVQAALGVARRAIAAAEPIADEVRQTVAALDGAAPTVTGHLGDLACCVVRQVVADRAPT